MIHAASATSGLPVLPIRSRSPSPASHHLPRLSSPLHTAHNRQNDRSASPAGHTSPLDHCRSPCNPHPNHSPLTHSSRSPPVHQRRSHSPSSHQRSLSPSSLHLRIGSSPVHQRSPSPGLSTSPKGGSSPPPHKSFSISSILSRDDPKRDALFPDSSPLTLAQQDAIAARLGLMSHMSVLAASRHPLLSLYPDLGGGGGGGLPTAPHGAMGQFGGPGGVMAQQSPLTSLSGALGKAPAPWYAAAAPWSFPHLAALTSSARSKSSGQLGS
ncbi:hypothetical protein FHG87_020971 [Trinorchestia longiramus]|nr:hypothetical protein FHG87_020971 [Trinorchestia longiramus]